MMLSRGHQDEFNGMPVTDRNRTVTKVWSQKIKCKGKVVEELEKNEAIDKKLLRYLTVKVKDFDLNTNYFTKKEDGEKPEKKERLSN